MSDLGHRAIALRRGAFVEVVGGESEERRSGAAVGVGGLDIGEHIGRRLRRCPKCDRVLISALHVDLQREKPELRRRKKTPRGTVPAGLRSALRSGEQLGLNSPERSQIETARAQRREVACIEGTVAAPELAHEALADIEPSRDLPVGEAASAHVGAAGFRRPPGRRTGDRVVS